MQVLLSLDPGGTERLAIELARRLHQHHEMVVCCLDRRGLWASELEDIGVPVTTLGRAPGFAPRLGQRIAAEAKRRRASVLHCHQYSPFVYGALARLWTPLHVIYTEHGRANDGPRSIKRRVVNTVLSRVPDGIYAVSEDLKRHMISEGFPGDRIEVVSNGVADRGMPDAAIRVAARTQLNASPTDYLVGAVGRLDPVKDLCSLIDGFSRFRQQAGKGKLILIGEGPERAALTEAIERERLEGLVTLLGQRSDVATLLPGLDVFVNSSIFEGVSLTLLEAMAAGLPIVATRVGGTPEVVIDGATGVLVPARSASALADALNRLAVDSDQRRAFGAAARARFESHYSIDHMAQRYAAIYSRFGGS